MNELVEVARAGKYITDNTVAVVQRQIDMNDEWNNANQQVIEQWIDTNGVPSFLAPSVLVLVLVYLTQLF